MLSINFNRTALHHTAKKGGKWINIAKILIEKGCDINKKDKIILNI